MNLLNAADPIRRLAETHDVEFDQGLITGDGNELRLTQKGLEQCKKLEDY